MDDGFCLIVAILKGVGVSTGRRSYDNRETDHPLTRGKLSNQTGMLGTEEKIQLGRDFYIPGCDSSTIKRNLKRENINNNIGSVCRRDENQDLGRIEGYYDVRLKKSLRNYGT